MGSCSLPPAQVKLRRASRCPASQRRAKEKGTGGDPQQPPDLRAAPAAGLRGCCCPGPPPPFPPRPGPCCLRQPQDLRRPARRPKLCPPLPGSGIPRFRSPGRPASGGQLGREGVREGAAWPLKSAPSYMWEAVAVTQVSRGPWAWRERARAAPLLAVATVKKKKKKKKSPEQHPRPPSPSQGPAARSRPPRVFEGADPVPGSPRRTPGAQAGLPRCGWPFLFFLLRLPTCQLMDLITHSGACSSAAARSIQAAPPRPPAAPAPGAGVGGGPQTRATTHPRGPAPLSPRPRAARGALQIVLCLHAIPYSAEGGRGSAEFSPAVSRLETDI